MYVDLQWKLHHIGDYVKDLNQIEEATPKTKRAKNSQLDIEVKVRL